DCPVPRVRGAAKQPSRDTARVPGLVRLCFQPAEEIGRGAQTMIAEGALADPRPEAAFGLHVWQDMDLGRVGVTSGPFMAAVDEFNVTLRGKGAHAAMPHFGVDPVVGVAHVITALQTLVSRTTDPFLPAVVSVTQVHAGNAFNIIPELATINGTVRVFDTGLWEQLPARFERVTQGVATALGLDAKVEYLRHN